MTSAPQPPNPRPPGAQPRIPPRLFAPNELLAFLLEILALLILADWGWHRGASTGTRLLQAIAAPLVAAVVWGLFAAPKARFRVSLSAQLVVKGLVFGAATWALFELRMPVLAVLFALVVVVNTAAATVWRRRGFSIAPPQEPAHPDDVDPGTAPDR
jgi:hypothetical protein